MHPPSFLFRKGERGLFFRGIAGYLTVYKDRRAKEKFQFLPYIYTFVDSAK